MALVQTMTPQQSSGVVTMTMLPGRSGNSNGAGAMNGAAGNAGVMGNNGFAGGYREGPMPIAPYAFTATPGLAGGMRPVEPNLALARPRYMPGNGVPGARDDMVLPRTVARPMPVAPRPASMHLPSSASLTGIGSVGSNASTGSSVGSPGRAQPDRYRRASSNNVPRPSFAAAPAMFQHQNLSDSRVPQQHVFSSMAPEPPSKDVSPRRSRRRSMLDASSGSSALRNASAPPRPLSANLDTRRASPSPVNGASAADNRRSVPHIGNLARPHTPERSPTPARSLASTASPLAKPPTTATVDMAVSPPSPVKPTKAVKPTAPSAAAQKLAAISDSSTPAPNAGKSKTSRLRRAFSFGSVAELRRASTPVRTIQEDGTDEPLDPEQERIARKQEEAGIGNNIYGRRFFSGSTDNLSISSTASSASVMIRKMGRGMKKSTRSLVGIFRPKSSSNGAAVPEASAAAVSMVTVEAERGPALAAGPVTLPTIDAGSLMEPVFPNARSPSPASTRGSDVSSLRRSINSDRAEMAHVRKGILKHTGNAAPSPLSETTSPATLSADATTGLAAPASLAPPGASSSLPNTPGEDSATRRAVSIAIGSEDYFLSALKLRQDSSSASVTGRTPLRRCATFSPRLSFHDTWNSGDYDRRGDVATCNRLTPLMAQQIKEELNNFKMEMEVHENSKVYTHFF